MEQAGKQAVDGKGVRIEGEFVCVTGLPDMDQVTVSIGQSCELKIGAVDAMQFALLLLNVASMVHREHLGAAAGPVAQPMSRLVM